MKRQGPGALSGAANHQWKGGRTIASNGYVLVKRPDHPMADVRGYVYEHRLVASEMLGRILLPSEQVHHRNHDKTDNRPENLEVMESRAHHALTHRRKDSTNRRPGEPNVTVTCACGCGGGFLKYDGCGRPRRFISGHNLH